MQTTTQDRNVPNESYEPDDDEEAVLRVMKAERRANPMLIRGETGIKKQYVNAALKSLVAAGWLNKVTTGLYEFTTDPRDEPAVTIQIDAEDAAELVDVLRRSDVAGAGVWADRLEEQADE